MIVASFLACNGSAPEASWSASRVLADREDSPQELVSDASYVYFTAGGNQASRDKGTNDIRRISLADGTVSEIVDGGPHIPNGALALDDAFLYWADATTLLRVPLAGGESEVVVGGRAMPVHPKELAVDGDRVYWIESTSEGTPPAPIMVTTKEPGPAWWALTEPLSGANGLCVDGAFVYVATPDGLLKIGKDGSGVVPLANSPAGVTVGLVHDRDNFYTTQLDGGRAVLLRVPKDGSAAVALAPSVFWPGEIAVDGEHVYFFDDDGQGAMALKRVPKHGGAVETLDSGRGQMVGHLAIGERDVYLTGQSVVIARAK